MTEDIRTGVATFQDLLSAAQFIARNHPFFTSNDLAAELRRGGLRLPEPRILGSVLVELRACGFAKPTGQYVDLGLPHNHRRPQQLWQSRVYGA